MLSKEEIEALKKLFQEVMQTKEKLDIRLTINKEVAGYLLSCINKSEQLETELKEVTTQRNKLATELSDNEDSKQDLIKELKTALDFARTGDDIISKTQVSCLENILKLVKGEK